ncbi:MAG: hypothetical protein K9M49_09055 [Candidatus Marinimicrobia bacterium]|nr:hypothetical protein [Candidatus Neomarinimicrobiota bacterium]MCF7851099.1 hypothetical protein [Candidatus Neomarinimicrobiota bacterium]MCF7905282.1 hypothetical protein [Candidatus Neomarinimicrobiota bacterium]
MSTIVLFEPENIGSFGPLILLRSVAELKYGILSNLERAQAVLPPDTDLHLWIRPVLAEDHIRRFPTIPINKDVKDECILLHAGIPAWHYPVLLQILSKHKEIVLRRAGVIIAVKSAGPQIFSHDFHHSFEAIPHKELDDQLLTDLPLWIWDYLDLIRAGIEFDLTIWKEEKQYLQKLKDRHSTLEEKQIFIHNTAELNDYVHLDASKGPIVIDQDSKVSSFSSLTGPLYIGKRSTVKPSANISQSIIGNVCNIGGEVKGSIIHPYSNKSHQGYLGDSMIGSWVNLGAGTNVSNLKNNYHDIRVSWDGNSYDTGRQFLGCMIGDHTKTAIGVRLNTGTFIGPFSNIFQNDFPPMAIPSFSWGNGVYEFDRAIETAKKVLHRRGKVPSATELALFKALAKDTTPFTHFK